MADIHRLKGEALTGRLQLCILTAGAAECSLNEGSGGAGTAHDVKSLCVCYLVWVSAERMSAGTAELQDSRTIFMAKYTVVEFDQKCCDGPGHISAVLYRHDYNACGAAAFRVSQNVTRCEHACTNTCGCCLYLCSCSLK